MMTNCDICGSFDSCKEINGEFICYDCEEILEEDIDINEGIDYDACDRASAQINDFYLQERY